MDGSAHAKLTETQHLCQSWHMCSKAKESCGGVCVFLGTAGLTAAVRHIPSFAAPAVYIQ